MESELSERVSPTTVDHDPEDDTDATGVSEAPDVPVTRSSTNGGGPAPVDAPPQVQVRRVRRVLRRIDPWSVLKLSFIFFVCMYAVIIVSSLLVWRAAVSSEIVDDVESFVIDLGFNDFQFVPDQMFRALLFGGAAMILVATFMAVLMTVLFNLISDLVGGIRVSMIEQQLLDTEKH